MTRTQFILSLPLIGAVGKLIAGEKKLGVVVGYDVDNKEVWFVKTKSGNIPIRKNDELTVTYPGNNILINGKIAGENISPFSVEHNRK